MPTSHYSLTGKHTAAIQVVRLAAGGVHHTVKSAKPSAVTALALQFAATNAPLSAVDGCFVTYWHGHNVSCESVRCSSLGTWARAFHTADMPPAQLAGFDEALRGAIGAWLTHPSHQHNTVYLSWPPTYRAFTTSHSTTAKLEKPTVTRQIVNEAANTLSCFVQVGVLQPGERPGSGSS